LPPTLKTMTPSHCTVRVAAGNLAQEGVDLPGRHGATLHDRLGACDGRAMTDWRPDKLGKTSAQSAGARARLQAALRQWFRGARALSRSRRRSCRVAPGAEVHLAGFVTNWELPDGEERVRWLHSSPEFAMKKAIGRRRAPGCFQFARVFRNAEGSVLHHPEFTMLEWLSRRRRLRRDHEGFAPNCSRLRASTSCAGMAMSATPGPSPSA